MKKIIAVLVAALTISSFGLIANAENVPTYYLGDTNKSTTVDTDDFNYLRSALLDNGKDRTMSDVNSDGNVDIADLVFLKTYIRLENPAAPTISQGENEMTDMS